MCYGWVKGWGFFLFGGGRLNELKKKNGIPLKCRRLSPEVEGCKWYNMTDHNKQHQLFMNVNERYTGKKKRLSQFGNFDNSFPYQMKILL